jgi:hypothetical protein
VRIHNPKFIEGALADGVSLNGIVDARPALSTWPDE